MALTMEVRMPRRPATAKIAPFVARKLDLDEDLEVHECFVLFASNEMDGEGCTPVFICEFMNGCVWNVPTEKVRFMDTQDY